MHRRRETFTLKEKASQRLIPEQPKERREVLVRQCYPSSESPSDDGHESDPNVQIERVSIITPEHWFIAKTMKFLRIGDPNSCLAALAFINGCDLKNLVNLKAIVVDSGLEMLVNLTEVNHVECIVGALNIIVNITHEPKVVRVLINLGICTNLLKCIENVNHKICSLACQVIAKVCHIRLAARNIRKGGGVKKLVGLLSTNKQIFLATENSLTGDEKIEINITEYASMALRTLCKFTKNKKEVLRTGVITIMSHLILSGNVKVSVPMTGVLCECSTEIFFQIAIESEGLIGVLLHDMESSDVELKQLCAHALANASEHHESVNHMLRYHNGIELIMDLLQWTDRHEVPFISALLKLVWKSSILQENKQRYESLKATYTIIQFVKSEEINWRINAAGAVAELAKHPVCCERLLSMNVIEALVSNFRSSNPQLLCNTVHAVGELVRNDKAAMETLLNCDGVRLMWTLMNHNSEEVQANALNSLVPVVEIADDPGELVRSLDYSLHILVKRLRCGHLKLIGSCCRLIAQVAKDSENLTVMTQHGLVKELCNLILKEGELLREIGAKVTGKNYQEIMALYSIFESYLNEDPDGVRQALVSAVGACSVLPENREEFGVSGIIGVLVMFLQTNNSELRAETCAALWELSRLEINSIQIHVSGAVPYLLETMSHDDMLSQIAAAGILANVRNILLANDLREQSLLRKCPPFERTKVHFK